MIKKQRIYIPLSQISVIILWPSAKRLSWNNCFYKLSKRLWA